MHTIISREDWGARYDRGFHDRDLPVHEVWLHHSVTVAPDLVPPWDDDYAAVRLLEAIGERKYGGGISYTFPITPAGHIFEGHGIETSGAHTLHRNDISASICWVGNHATTPPTWEQIVSTAWLLVHGKRRGWWTSARLSGGHGQAPGQSTDCPGEYARAAIATVNALSADYEAGRIDLDHPDPREDTPSMGHIVKGDASRDVFVVDVTTAGTVRRQLNPDEYEVVGGSARTIPQATMNRIKEGNVAALIATAVHNAKVPVDLPEDSPLSPAGFEPHHRVVAAINQHTRPEPQG